jgi:hypothetical protein
MGIPNGAKPIKIKEISFSNSGVASINNKLNMKTLDSIIKKKYLWKKKQNRHNRKDMCLNLILFIKKNKLKGKVFST